MVWRVRGRARMRELVRRPRHRHGALAMQRMADEPDTPPRIAFSIPRRVGTAVERNRIRRQLRALVRQYEHLFGSAASYLLSVTTSAAPATRASLERDLLAVLAALERSDPDGDDTTASAVTQRPEVDLGATT